MNKNFKTLTGEETKKDLIELELYLKADKELENRIEISPDAYMNKEFINLLAEVFHDLKPRFLIKLQNETKNRESIFNSSETEKLNNNSKYLKEKGIKSCLYDERTRCSYDLDEVIRANIKIDKWVNQINSARVDNQELSPLEKFLYIYNILSDFTYNKEDENETYMQSRSVVNVLNGDKIVCVGFANLLVTVCNKIGIPCINQDWSRINGGGHACCNVYIKDEKYGIDDIYFSDPTAQDNKLALVRHSDYKEIMKTFGGEKYENLEFNKTISSSNVNNDIIDFLRKTSNHIKQKNIEYLKYCKKNRNQNYGKVTANPFSLFSLVGEYIQNPHATKEEKMQILENHKTEIIEAMGITDLEYFYTIIEEAIEHALKNSKDKNKSFESKIISNMTIHSNNIPSSYDDKIDTLKADLIPLKKIEQALTNVYKTSSKTKDSAKILAQGRIGSTSSMSVKATEKIVANIDKENWLGKEYCEDIVKYHNEVLDSHLNKDLKGAVNETFIQHTDKSKKFKESLNSDFLEENENMNL